MEKLSSLTISPENRKAKRSDISLIITSLKESANDQTLSPKMRGLMTRRLKAAIGQRKALNAH